MTGQPTPLPGDSIHSVIHRVREAVLDTLTGFASEARLTVGRAGLVPDPLPAAPPVKCKCGG